MDSQRVAILCNFVMLLLLNSFIHMDVTQANNGCFLVNSKPTEGNLLYAHSEIFGTTATQKDVEAFKYYCANKLIESTINQKMSHLENLSCITTVPNIEILENLALYRTLNENTTNTICGYYAEIKAYQYMLYKLFISQNLTNSSIVSIMYLLQSVGESLQSIKYNNHETFCTDFVGDEEKIYEALVATSHDSIESVLVCLRDRYHWKVYRNYPVIFETSPCVDYKDERCQFYTSLYQSVIGQD